jgi:3-hydroxymyristoyl/3-hydroxydecanoyl-(acyl carrier protein) dehydratase/protein-S-isoprenylcysteine O-methyltransferase Ste14
MRFLLVDAILEWEPGKQAKGVKNVSLSEDFFDDHFPLKPIMPGVLIVEGMAQLSGLLLEESMKRSGRKVKALMSMMEKAKFRYPVYPGSQNVAGYFAWQTWRVCAENRLDFIEGVFIIHNIVICLCFLLRRPARAIQTAAGHQAVAVCAFYSGIFFIGPTPMASPFLLELSWWTILVGVLLGILSLIQLGRSFGVLIAVREVRTSGLYAWVRHPMYLSGIVMRMGYCFSHPSWANAALFLASSACYVVRAVLEERFLAKQDPRYADYLRRARYRFIPGIV